MDPPPGRRSTQWICGPVEETPGGSSHGPPRHRYLIGTSSVSVSVSVSVSESHRTVSGFLGKDVSLFVFLATPVQVSRSRFGDRFPRFGDCFAVPFRVKFLKPSVSFFVFFGPRWRENMVQKKGTRKRSQMVPIPGARFSRGKITEMELWATSEQRPSRPLSEAGPQWHRTRHLCIRRCWK